MHHLEPISLRVSLTNRCNMRCRYCRPAGQGNFEIRNNELSASEWIRRIGYIARATTVEKLRFTGGEPLLYSQIVDVVAGCSRMGIPGLAMTTNAIRLAELAQPLKEAGLQRVNISLDSLRRDVFKEITGRELDDVLTGIEAAKRHGLALKLNTVVQRGYNDDELTDLLEFAAGMQVHIRFLELMPIGPAAADFDDCYVSGEEIREKLKGIADLEPLWYKQGETSRDHKATLRDGRTTVCGFILPTSTPFCKGCRRLRLDPAGRLYGCLAQPDTFPLLNAFASAHQGDLEPIRRKVDEALSIKKRPQEFRQQTSMIEIGG